MLSARAGFGGWSSAFEAPKSLMVLVIRCLGYVARRFTQSFNQFTLATRSRRSLKLRERTAYCKPTVCSLPISLDLRDAGYVGYTLRHLSFVQQLPTLLRQQCWKLLRKCWQWSANGCNNSQQWCDLQCIVGRIQPISLCKPLI